MSRSVLLEKIRHASRLASASPSQLPQLPSQLPEFPCWEDPIATFSDELQEVGGVFIDARREDQLAAALSVILEQAGSTEIYWEGGKIFEKHDLPYSLRHPDALAQGDLLYSFHFGSSVKFPLILNSKPWERRDLARVTLSISSALYGVAETGSIVHQVTTGTGRLLSVLPLVHAVLLSEKDLLSNHRELFETLRFQDCGSAVTIITGPSRTADIEKTLILGVHGPQYWYVILTR